MRYFTVTLGLILTLTLFFCVFLSVFPGFEIRTNELVIVDDREEVFRLIEKNTPIRIEITNERWGQAVLENPEVLFEVWKVLQEAKSYPNRYVPNQDRIEGYIYFRDGSREYFSISDRFQLGEYLLECKDDELNIAKLHRIFRHTLETKKISWPWWKRRRRSFFPRGRLLCAGFGKMVKITGDAKSQLLTCLALAEKVEESSDLTALLLEKGVEPLFHLTFM